MTYRKDEQDLCQSPVFHKDLILVIELNVQRLIQVLHHQTKDSFLSIRIFNFDYFTCVDQRLRYRKAGNFIKCSAQALVTLVNAKLRHSRFPNDPLDNNLAKSLSVDLDGNVNFLGPPFCCNSLKAICRSHTLAYIFNPVEVDCKVEINCNLLSRFSTASKSNMAQRV